MSEKLYGGHTLQEIYDVMNRSAHGGEIQWDEEQKVATAALPDLLGSIAELTTLRAENAELREALDGLLPNSLKSRDGYCSMDGHITIRASCDEIDRARAALAKGEK